MNHEGNRPDRGRGPAGPPRFARPYGGQPPQPPQIRTFVAIVPPSRMIAEVKKLQQRLAAKISDRLVRWSEPAQLHLTLRFLGNVPRNRLNELVAAVRHSTEELGPFRLSLERLGCFPHTRTPRVIWVGVGHNWEVLRRLHERLMRDTDEFGEPPEGREFQPHVSLARVKAPSPRLARPAGQVVESAGIIQLGEWLVSRIDILQSQTTPQRTVYHTLASVHLEGLPGMID